MFEKIFNRFKKQSLNTEKLCDDLVSAADDVASTAESAGKLAASDTAKRLAAGVANCLGRLKAVIDEQRFGVPFTFAECIKYLASHAKDSPKITKGAILREPSLKGNGDGQCWEVSLFFLDSGNNPVCDGGNVPLGFKTTRSNLDEELNSAFKNNNLIIVE